MKNSKQAFVRSVIALVLCVSMFVGTTFAWFTDEVVSVNNIIQTGILDVELDWFDESAGAWKPVDQSTNVFAENSLWEPGYTEVVYLRVRNAGNLALKYQLGVRVASQTQGINVNDEPFLLSDYIYMGVATENIGENSFYADRDAARAAITSSNSLTSGKTVNGEMLKDEADEYFALVVYMPETVGNEANYKVGTTQPTINLGITLLATQMTAENDSFGPDYDTNATFPVLKPGSVTVPVTPGADNRLTEDVAMVNEEGTISAVVPAGTLLNPGTTSLTFSVSELSATQSNVVLKENEILRPMDVHIEGVAAGNTTPIQVTIKEAAMPGLNSGNYALYHVENGATNEMTDGALNAHNGFAYDPATGDVKLSMATFSEIAVVNDTENAWEGKFDYSWYDASKTELTIANADQLAAFGAIVGGMAKDENGNVIAQNSFSGKTVKLNADINLGYNAEKATNYIFYPIGYYNSTGSYEKVSGGSVTSTVYSFEGTFDGNGHTIANFYQNTWEMFGDYNDGYSGTPNHYDDAMGLFGYVVNGKICNLTVDNFSSDGEFTPTGVIAAYAVNSTFENIAITNCNPRVYNTGNGGIVGIGGNSDDPDTYKLTFNNITIDNTNIITALWGSWDVACGGLVGMFRGAGHVSMTNCHVAAQMDVYNDVCGNYQYYWYRYAGMMIGTNKTMITDANGYTVPETEKFHAEGCTVHFGDWNDYYYCELVANSLASYTHDHQFSRLTEVKAIDGTTITYLDGTTGTVPASGRANYVIVNGEEGTENATCYHFLNGEVWEHEEAGTEIVNGKEVLKEDNQHIYLPFNQLFTGYGWGVKHIPVYNGEDYAFEGIIILDRKVANSVVKFQSGLNTLNTNQEYKLSDIFSIKDSTVAVYDKALMVTVTNLDEKGNVIADIVYDRDNWENGTIEFTNAGKISITIQDYYFCKPTTIEVTITERVATEKFATKFTGDFLYRVGNQNAVSIGYLFEEIKDVSDSGVYVTVDKVDENMNVSGTFTANTSDWTKGTIQFSGTGVVKVTIQDYNFCKPTELYLEVVDAKNITSATGTTTGGNLVLLCDVNSSSYVNYRNCTLYGNGFTYTLKGAPTAYNGKQGHGILITQNATLDNLVIIGDVYEEYGAYQENACYNAAIDVQGSTRIQNCFIANCAAPVKTRGDVTIVDTTLYGGAVANLIIMSGVVTLESVTTANYEDGRSLVGMGIVVHSDAADGAKLVLNGKLTQYNFVSEAKKPDDVNAKGLYDVMFGTACSKFQFGTSPNRYVNTGIISLTTNFGESDIIDNAQTGYEGLWVDATGYDGYVYTQPNTTGTVNNGYDQGSDLHKSRVQGDYLPTPEFSLGNQAVTGEDHYLKGDINGVEARYIKGETPFDLDITKLMKVFKYTELYYDVTASCKDANGNAIALNNGKITLDVAGEYVLVFTVQDNEFYNPNGTKTDKSVPRTYEVPLTVIVAEPAIKDAVIKVNKTALEGGYNESYGDRSYKFNPLNAITITDAEGTVNLTTNIASTNIVYASSSSAFAGDTTITVTYNDGRVLEIKLGKPNLNSPGSSKAITYENDGTIKSAAKVASKSAKGGTWTVTSYSFKGTNGKTVTNNTVVTFNFPDKSCVTGDTLVMLADGTQKRIDEVTYNDQLLVWNFFTGEYDVVPSAIIFFHGDDLYRVLKLHFEDGTTVKVINNHGFFDMERNEFMFITEDNVKDYIGHSFAKVNGKNRKAVKLVSYSITEEYTGCYSIQSAVHNNFMTEGMFSLTIPHYDGWFDYFEIGEGMKYDEEKMQADIEKYGLYDYSEFADYVTYEQFVAFNGPYLKVLVGRGVVTLDQIFELIATYVNP